MPADSPSPSGTPEPDRPEKPDAPAEAGEADLWNLDEDLPAKSSASPVPRQMNRKPEGEEAAPAKNIQRGQTRAFTPERTSDEGPLPQPQPRPAEDDEFGELDEKHPDDADEDGAVLVVVPEHEIPAAVETAPEIPAEPAAAEAGEDKKEEDETEPLPQRNPMPKSAGENRPRSTTGRRDVIGLGVFAFLLLMTGIWVVSRFFSQLHFDSGIMRMPDFPVEGQHAVLETAETYWREPVREGPNRDTARREVAMIPVLDLTLDSENSSLGALRVIFRDDSGAPLGDSITRSFVSGRFDASGEARISFPATDGFLDTGTFNGYRTRKGRPWTVDVMEGPTVDAPASSFRKLAEIPILPQSR